MRALGNKLARRGRRRPGQYHVLLSHVHWDHIQGLPFFSPAYIPGTRDLGLRAAHRGRRAQPGDRRHHAPRVLPDAARGGAGELRLPSGRARRRLRRSARFTSRRSRSTIRSARSAIASMPMARRGRTSPTPRRSTRCSTSSTSCRAPSRSATTTRPRSSAMRDALVAAPARASTPSSTTRTFLPEEYARFPHYGHSTPDQALEICAEANVRRLVLYHHAPSHTDDQMDQIAARYLAKGAARRHRGADLVRGHDAADRDESRSPRSEAPVLGRAWLVRDVRAATYLRYGGNTTLGRARQRRRRSPADRSRHRRDRTREAADGQRVRQGAGQAADPALAHAPRSHPGPAVLHAVLHQGQRDPDHGRGPDLAGSRSRRRCRTSSRRTTRRSTASRTSPPACRSRASRPARRSRCPASRSRPPRSRTAACGRPRSGSPPTARSSRSSPTSSTRRPTSRCRRRSRSRSDADLLIHDAMHADHDYEHAPRLGPLAGARGRDRRRARGREEARAVSSQPRRDRRHDRRGRRAHRVADERCPCSRPPKARYLDV